MKQFHKKLPNESQGRIAKPVRMESDDPNENSYDDSYNTDGEEVEWEHIRPQLSQDALQAGIAGLGTALEEAEADDTQHDSISGADVAGLMEVKHQVLQPAMFPRGTQTPELTFVHKIIFCTS